MGLEPGLGPGSPRPVLFPAPPAEASGQGRRGGAGAPLHPSPALLAFRVKDPMAAGDDCGHIRFFSFSLIEGYISLVMDVQTQQR